jgi:hypothetical protein
VMEDGIFAWAAAMASIGVVMWRHGVMERGRRVHVCCS